VEAAASSHSRRLQGRLVNGRSWAFAEVGATEVFRFAPLKLPKNCSARCGLQRGPLVVLAFANVGQAVVVAVAEPVELASRC
jgi:hypothetical protein